MEIHYSPVERKIALMRLGVSQRTVARKARTNPTMVCHVMKGYPLVLSEGHATRVRNVVAQLLGKPVEVVFPEYAEHIAKKAVA